MVTGPAGVILMIVSALLLIILYFFTDSFPPTLKVVLATVAWIYLGVYAFSYAQKSCQAKMNRVLSTNLSQ